jgi:hypothetical protein
VSTPWLLPVIALLIASPPRAFEDEALRLDLPEGWTIEGEAGEYRLLSSEDDAASLLLLLAEFEGTLSERLAEIERQFVETGLIEPEASETRQMDGGEVLYRRYRLTLGGAQGPDDEAVLLLHQYSFERANIPVLLQIEADPDHATHEELFRVVFSTLEIRRTPDGFLFQDAAGSEGGEGE